MSREFPPGSLDCEMQRFLKELDTINDDKLDGVEFARDPHTELHNWLEWDDAEAARKYRFMADADVRPDIAERVLGHAIEGVGGVYDRSAYAEQKAQALAALATRIELILKPRKNVTPIRGRKHA